MNILLRQVVCAFALLLATSAAMGQVATGTYTFGTFDNKGIDAINVGNLNIGLSVPVLNKAGRGMPFSYNLRYDSSVWSPATVNGSKVWTPAQAFGWHGDTEIATGYLTYSSVEGQIPDPNGPEPWIFEVYGNFVYHDRFGVSHAFSGAVCRPVTHGCPIESPTYFPPLPFMASDGSGFMLNGFTPGSTLGQVTSGTVSASNGKQVVVPTVTNGSATVTDTNGNQISTDGAGHFTDTLGDVVLTLAGNAPNPKTFSYTNPQGNQSAYTMNYEQYTVATHFGVSGIAEYGPLSTSLVSNIELPDGSKYTFTYEATPAAAACTPISGTYSEACVTGRLASVTLPTGGTVTYTYTGGNNGIESDGSTAGLTRTLSTGGSWQYSRALVSGTPGAESTWTTTVIDPNNDYAVINFAEDSTTITPGGTSTATPATYNLYETQRALYQGSISPSHLLASSVKCYNGNYSSCATANVGSPITQTDAYAILPNGNTNLSEITYNTYGLVTDDKEYGYGVSLGAAPSSTYLVRETATNYYAPSNSIATMRETSTLTDWSTGHAVTLASSSYTYDGAAVTTTSGTLQHIAVSGARGNLTQVTTSTSTTASLTASYTYYDTGTFNVLTAVNGAQTTYVYGSGSCNNSFATSVNGPLGLSNSAIWNCVGGITTTTTDSNGNSITTNYADSEFWRPTSTVDQQSNDSTINYIGKTAVETSLANFNGGNSVLDSRTTVDGFGRTVFSQRLQGPGATTYDTNEVDYNTLGQPYRTTMAYSATASPSSSNTAAPATITTYDALGRVLSRTDADGGKVTYTYTNNDVLQAVTGTQTFKKQFEYDGLGRLTSVCEISVTLSGVGTCGQATPQTGYWTKYTYDAVGHLLTVTQNAQAAATNQQTRTYAYDLVGRLTSEKNPETGTRTYFWDVGPSACFSHSFPGNLVATEDNAGIFTCYGYDALNRAFGFNATNTNNCRGFIYDSSTAVPAGVTIQNGKGRMIAAYTNSACNGRNSLVVDEWFSYSPRGELTDVYESTPHSGGYYHTTAAYWATGALKTLSGIPGVPTLNYGANGTGLDGEGRYTKVTAASGTNPIAGITYSTSSTTNYLGALTGVTFGSGDADSFTYDPNTGRMSSYNFSVNGQNDTGTLTWNSNGTLGGMAINDQITGTSDSQTCTYGYDDLRRVSSANCGTIWGQNFTYDALGNISKSVPTGSSGLSFLPGYSTTPPTNQFLSLPGITPKYDANGNLLTDNLNTYTWDAYGKMLTVSTGSTTVTAIYDASGRMVENNVGGPNQTFVYGPTGSKLAIANGQTLVKAFIALPGGVKAIYNSTGLAYYRHSDWLGSSRLTSTSSRTLYSSTAYSPFGEQYSKVGAADASFTGQDQDTVPSLYDFPARRYSPSQGRWISPDPLGIRAVTMSKPQSWNRYAYALNNPLALIDSMGMSVRHRGHAAYDDPSNPDDPVASGDDDDDDDNGGGGGGDDDDGDPSNPGVPCVLISAGIATNDGAYTDSLMGSGDMVQYPYDSGIGSNPDAADAMMYTDYGSSDSNPIVAGVGSVIYQGLIGPNANTQAFADGLNSAASTNSNITLVLFSGSAQAFATAYNSGMINGAMSSIQQIIYVSPGVVRPTDMLAAWDPNTDPNDWIPTAFYSNPGQPIDDLVTGGNSSGLFTPIDSGDHDLMSDLSSGAIQELPSQSDCNDSPGFDNIPPPTQ